MPFAKKYFFLFHTGISLLLFFDLSLSKQRLSEKKYKDKSVSILLTQKEILRNLVEGVCYCNNHRKKRK